MEIGDHCMFANGCFVTDGDHRFDDPDKPVPWQGFTTKGPTRVGDNVWCGANVVITSGVTIGERCVIGANSVVTRDLRPTRSPPELRRRCCAAIEYPDWARTQEFLITMPSMMLATCSVASIAASRRSNRSFQRITTIGSMPPSNSDATASRVMRSPSFSSRLISTV